LGVGNGTITSFSSFAVGKNPFGVAVADFNGDNKPDLAVTNSSDGTVSTLLGNGDGTFQTAMTNAVGLQPMGIVAADFNSDGKADLAVANLGSDTVSLQFGNGNGTFQIPQGFTVGNSPQGPDALAIADFNGDGLPDIIVTNTLSNTVAILLDGALTAPIVYPVGNSPQALAVGDFSGNQSVDVAVVNVNSNDVTILLDQAIVGRVTVLDNAAVASHFTVSAPSAVSAGSPLVYTVTALDAFNNTAAGYKGTVQFSSSDTAAVLPAPSTMTSGVGKFTAALATVGTQTITATDSVTSSVTGASNGIAVSVNASGATHFHVSAPTAISPNQAFVFTVTAQDQFNNTATSYNGIVNFTTSDNQASIPSNATLSSGVGYFAAILRTAGNQTIAATDAVAASITGISNNIVVSGTGTAATHFAVSIPSATTAGDAFVVVVTAEDQFNNPTTSYSGAIIFSSSDGQASLPVGATMTGGVGFFAAILKTAGTQTISARDSLAASLTGISNSAAVSAAAASHYTLTANLPSYPGVLSGPTQFASTGLPLTFTVTALDPYGNVAPTYTGTVQFSSSDSAATLPAPGTLTSGVGTFTATLKTPGSQTLSATDTIKNSGPNAITGTSSPFPVRGLVVTGFAATPGGFTLTFNKPFKPGTVNLYTAASLPDDVILATAGSQVSVRGSAVFDSATNPTTLTFVKTMAMSALGTFNPTSGLLTAGNYTVTLRSFSAGSSGFQDFLGSPLDGNNSGVPGGNFKITFSVAPPPVAVGIPDFARGPSNTDAVFLPTTIGNGGTFNLIYSNPAVSPNVGTATITFSTTGATLQSSIQAALNNLPQISTTSGAPNAVALVLSDNASVGANVLITFQNSLATATNQLLASGTSGVTISFASINAAAAIANNGIPIALSNGQNVTSGSFTLQFNPNLLNITGVVSKINGATFTVSVTDNNATSATALLSLSSPTKISSTTSAITLGSLLANVPLAVTATYGNKQLLHFSAMQLNGTAGPIAITNEDGVQVAAFFGDVTGTGGPFSVADASTMSVLAGSVPNTVAQTLPGFAAFPDLDPVIIGDVAMTGLGFVSSTDASAMNQQIVAARPSIPFAPAGLPVTPAGPDPTLSVDSMQYAVGSNYFLLSSVNIDTAHPAGSSGMTDAILALAFDPTVFDVSASDVQLGSVPQSSKAWQLKAEVNNQTGLIGIELFGGAAIQESGSGSLVTIAMHTRTGSVPANDRPLVILPYADPSGGTHVYQTQVSDSQGAFVLEVANAAPTSNSSVASAVATAPSAAPQPSETEIRTQDIRQPAPDLTSEVVERVFGELASTVNGMPPSAYVFGQPGPVVKSDPVESSRNGDLDIDLLLAFEEGSQMDNWLSKSIAGEASHADEDLVCSDEAAFSADSSPSLRLGPR
jgi:hypothetical protein